MGTHFLAKSQPTKGNQASISPNYCPSHQSTQLAGQLRKDAFQGAVLADPVSAASGATAQCQSILPGEAAIVWRQTALHN